MYKDPDSKIREYVLKKKQQKERARQLKELRRNKEYLTQKETSNKYQRRQRKTTPNNIIAEPFASISNHENSNYSNFPQMNNHQMKSQCKVPSIHQNNHQQRRTPTNNSNMRNLLAMMNDFRTQIDDLQYQIDDLKYEIKELKQKPHQNHEQYIHQQNNLNAQTTSHHNHSMQTRSHTHSTASSSSRSSEQYEYKNDVNIKTNMNKRLAHLKKRRNSDSMKTLNGNTTNRSMKRIQSNNKYVANNHTLSHSSSAMAFVNKLSSMNNVVEEVQRIECRQCGRKFIKSALQRHIRICKNVFCKKRKVFNTQSKRVDKDAKNAQSTTGDNDYKLNKIKHRKKVNWKAKSAMLRDAIAASRDPNTGIKTHIQQYDDRVECPYCQRRFAEQTAERHIPKCRDIIAKPKRLRRR